MILTDIFRDMTYGELSNIFTGGYLPDEAESQPDPVKYAELLSAVNLGLKQLYKEFFLRSEEHYIQCSEEKSVYKLHIDYAQTNTSSPIDIADRYIMDTADNPFTGNLLKIEEVYDEDGVKLTLNNPNDELSVFTPTYNSIQVPYPEDGMTIAVQFRASHPPIVYTGVTFDPDSVEVELPNSLHDALLYYVAARILRPKGGDRVMEADNYYQLYKDAVQTVKNEGLEVQSEADIGRFDTNGWV